MHTTTLASPPAERRPQDREAIADALIAQAADSATWWGQWPSELFFTAQGAGWSPADHLRHLTISVRPVAGALRIPRLVLLLRFGRGPGLSAGYDAVRDRYRARLAQGGGAGAFAPSPQGIPDDRVAARAALLATHEQAVSRLAAAVRRWPEPSLDRRRLPHPLLGLLTVREMLFFTLYHNWHHLDVVARKQRDAMDQGAPGQSAIRR